LPTDYSWIAGICEFASGDRSHGILSINSMEFSGGWGQIYRELSFRTPFPPVTLKQTTDSFKAELPGIAIYWCEPTSDSDSFTRY
jgi:hypothetical protein